jgi:hypothetical protein
MRSDFETSGAFGKESSAACRTLPTSILWARHAAAARSHRAAQLAQILGGKLPQDRSVDVIVAESFGILAEPQPAQPRRYVHAVSSLPGAVAPHERKYSSAIRPASGSAEISALPGVAGTQSSGDMLLVWPFLRARIPILSVDRICPGIVPATPCSDEFTARVTPTARANLRGDQAPAPPGDRMTAPDRSGHRRLETVRPQRHRLFEAGEDVNVW